MTSFVRCKPAFLAFWDKDDKINTLVIATHGFIKKTQKTPPKERAQEDSSYQCEVVICGT